MGTLSYRQNTFIFQGTFQENGHPKQAGFYFDGRVWKTTSLSKALKLRAFADSSAQETFKSLSLITRECPIIKVKNGLKLYDFQVESATHMLTRNRSYVADDAGLGKTISSITAFNCDPGPTLVVCPPFLKINWAREFAKWSCHTIDIFSVNKGTDLTPQVLKDYKVIILPDSLVIRPTIQRFLATKRFKWVFIDEAHRFKSDGAKRTAAVFGSENTPNRLVPPIVKLSENVVALSGTPMPNRPMELYPIIKSMAPEVIDHASFFDFANKYCAAYEGPHGWDYRGASNLHELGMRLKEKFLIRHKKEDVLKELPPKTRQVIRLESPKSILRYEKALLRDYSMTDILGAVQNDFYKDNKMLGELAKYRSECATEKTIQAIDFVKDILDGTEEKVIVFAHHISVVENLASALYKYGALKVRGGVPNATRDSIVNEFQKNKNVRVVVGNIQSMGVGFTLTAATRVVFAEYSWVPGENSQAEDRAHRIGNTGNVLCQYLVSSNLDEYVLNAVIDKEKNIERVGL